MKVGILGSGDVAKVLAGGFLKHGHEVMMGTREPAKLAEWGRAAIRTRASAALPMPRSSASLRCWR